MSNGASSDGFQSTASLLKKYQVKDTSQYVSQEFQDFGYRLAVALDDLPHKSLYIKMAKKIERAILESALSFVSDSNARNKARLFMWKVKQIQATQPDTQKNKKKESTEKKSEK